MNESVASDPQVLQLLEEYRPAVIELTKTAIGVTKVNLNGLGCRAIGVSMVALLEPHLWPEILRNSI